MMSFFSSPFCAAPADTGFTPLFRLLDDFESYQQQLQDAQQQNNNTSVTHQRRQSPARSVPTFKPRFDVRETENAYILHGELAGLERENVEIEFTEPQTMVIRGRVERTYEKKPEEEQQQPKATSEVTEEDKNQKRRNSHQATVEDDPEEPSTPVHTPPESPQTKPADKRQQVQKSQNPQAPAAPQPRYWAYERSVGEFSRAFSFPTRVEHDSVSANLDNGILTVTVPKAKKHEVRRIAIN